MPITTLLVDGAPDVRGQVRAALRKRGGFDVVGEAGTGERGVDLARSLRPQMIVLDLSLPDLTSRDLMARMRSGSPDSQIIVFSGNDPDRPWLEQHAEGYLLKDDDVEQLIGLMEELGAGHARASVRVPLPYDSTAVREAREAVRDVLQRWGYRTLVEDAVLIVSELVTNAVRHAGSSSAVVISRSEGGVRLEVVDQGTGTPQMGDPPADAESGRGLMIVTSLSTAWGLSATEESKTVWVELTPSTE